MKEPPTSPGDDEVLALVRTHWDASVDRVEHLPVGFGAHHWQAFSANLGGQSRPLLFVTYDTFAARHTAESLEAAYASAADLAFALDAVVAGLPSDALTYTLPVADGALSVTPWVNGVLEDEPADPVDVARMLSRLHRAHPPSRLPRWRPLVAADYADRLAETLATPRESGPQAPPAYAALTAHLDDVRRWVTEYHHLAALAQDRPWVVTHGEPHRRNRLVTLVRLLLVDWESVRLAPRERDLVHTRSEHIDLDDADPEMLRLFDLEWRLDEISQYAAWFAAPHTGTADDLEALAGLVEELERPDA